MESQYELFNSSQGRRKNRKSLVLESCFQQSAFMKQKDFMRTPKGSRIPTKIKLFYYNQNHSELKAG